MKYTSERTCLKTDDLCRWTEYGHEQYDYTTEIETYCLDCGELHPEYVIELQKKEEARIRVEKILKECEKSGVTVEEAIRKLGSEKKL